jgi:hypothetical protein
VANKREAFRPQALNVQRRVSCTSTVQAPTCHSHKSCSLPPNPPLRPAPAASNAPQNLTLNKPPRARAARPSTAARACNCKCAPFRRAQRPQIYGAIARCEQGKEGKLTALHPRCAGMQPHRVCSSRWLF